MWITSLHSREFNESIPVIEIVVSPGAGGAARVLVARRAVLGARVAHDGARARSVLARAPAARAPAPLPAPRQPARAAGALAARPASAAERGGALTTSRNTVYA